MVLSRNLRGDRRSGLVLSHTFSYYHCTTSQLCDIYWTGRSWTAYAATYLVFKKASAFVWAVVFRSISLPIYLYILGDGAQTSTIKM